MAGRPASQSQRCEEALGEVAGGGAGTKDGAQGKKSPGSKTGYRIWCKMKTQDAYSKIMKNLKILESRTLNQAWGPSKHGVPCDST